MERAGTDKCVYVIAGPTAVGKTAIAIRLAQHLGTDIISADSRQCYREMSIGTAKPGPAELRQVRHHFIDAFNVREQLSAADFEKLSLSYLEDIFRHSNTAVVCGGTGLYIQALCSGLDDMPDVDAQVIADVNEQYQLHGLTWLQETIQMEDPRFHKQGETQNPARLIRALVFKRSTGESILTYHNDTHKQRDFRVVKIALDLPREVLYDRINQRVDKMMETGLLEEVKNLYALRHLKNLQTVGYTEIFDHLDGKLPLPEAVEKIKQHTRNYAKRQLTWFRRDKDYTWIEADDERVMDKILRISTDKPS